MPGSFMIGIHIHPSKNISIEWRIVVILKPRPVDRGALPESQPTVRVRSQSAKEVKNPANGRDAANQMPLTIKPYPIITR